METLTEFLLENTVSDLTAEVVISSRLKDFKFKIKAMTNKEFSEYTETSRRVSGKRVSFDSERFNMLVILNNTLEPDFCNAETIKKSGALTPQEFVTSRLLPGEITKLSQEIAKLSGFDQDLDMLVQEAKN